MIGWLNRAATMGALLLVAGCAGLPKFLSAPDPEDVAEAIRIHDRMGEEALRAHREAHEQTVREAERIRDLPPPPAPPEAPPAPEPAPVP